MSDDINHPTHYTHGGIETIDFIEAKELSYCLGNVVKYVSRAGHKGDALEDLKKAAWYLRREIKRLGGSVGDDEGVAMRQRDQEISDLKNQIKKCRELLDSRFKELQDADEHRKAALAKAAKVVAQRDEARKQVVDLTMQLMALHKRDSVAVVDVTTCDDDEREFATAFIDVDEDHESDK